MSARALLIAGALILVSLPAAMASPCAAGDSLAFIKGADVSLIPQIEDLGGTYLANGIAQDPLKIMQERGINLIRLKIWHAPVGNYNNLARILIMARRIKEHNLNFLLDFHYSDTWADPGKQTKPAAWNGIPFAALKDSVFAYTKNVMSALNAQNTLPDIVQLGNEIVAGMLWNDGRVGGSYETNQQWQNLAALLNAGIDGVRQSGPEGDSVRIMIHIDRGGDNVRSRWFYDRLIANNVPFDIIGLSYYPWWHGALDKVRTNLNDLAVRYNKDIIIAETAYPWTLQWYDSVSNIVGSTTQLLTGYPASTEGQKAFLKELMHIIGDVRNGRGKGLIYWAPEYIAVQPIGSPWENNALFDFKGNVLSSMDVFMPPVIPDPPIQVTIRLNTSTLMDTLQEWHAVQIRGEISNVVSTSSELPDGRRVTWEQNSELWLKNMGGDYWQITFPMYPGDALSYKFWSGFSAVKPTFQRLGWEGPVIESGVSSAASRWLVAGERDTVVQVQYFNSTGEVKLQYWLPFEHKNDSIAVYFRVSMAKAMAAGRFNPETNGPVFVRGSTTAVRELALTLAREAYSVGVGGGAFWSGAAWFAKTDIQENDTLHYTFSFDNAGKNGQENSVPCRMIIFNQSLNDTTLHWVYFDDGHATNVAIPTTASTLQFRLEQNYPNPFNGETRIGYTLTEPRQVSIRVFDLQGRLQAELVHRRQPAGQYSMAWQPEKTQSGSGVYLLVLQAGPDILSRKMLYLK